jgi:hypothetical protein
MSMSILGGKQHKAERIARDIVKDLTVMDIDWTIAESMGREGEQRLCSAIDEDFLINERRLSQLEKKITDAVNDDIGKLLDDYDHLWTEVSVARQKASFALGYFAALRLVGVVGLTPKPKGKRR